MHTHRLVCAQVESLGVNGLALARGNCAIGFRGIPLLPNHGRFDGKLPVCTLRELGPYDPDCGYNHVSFQTPITEAAATRFLKQELFWGNSIVVPDFAPGEAATVHLEWCFDGVRALARFTADAAVDLMLLVNGCTRPAEVETVTTDQAVLKQNDWTMHLRCAGASAGDMIAAEDVERLECRLRGLLLPASAPTTAAKVAGIRFRLKPDHPVSIVIGEQPIPAPQTQAVEQALLKGREQLPTRLMASSGAAEDCADAVQRLVGFCNAYDLRSHRRIAPVNRDWAGPNSTPPIFMWDNFFDSYLACFHNPELARDSLAHIVDVIRNRGIRGAPPQRNLVVPIVYSKTVRMLGDPAFMAETFPVMMTFMRFWFEDRGDGHPWRDGNDDGLIECGTFQSPGQGMPLSQIVTEAFDETGYDDSPMYSAGFGYERRGLCAEGVSYHFERGTLNLTMVGQNCLYVAACRAMAVVAGQVGANDDRQWLLAEADRAAERIRERLFDPETGIFRNRFFNDDFSSVKTPDLFTPLLAGVADADAKVRLREMLLDPAQFWGDNVVPTVSRDDPAYCDDDRHGPYWRGNYWRGNIWPPTNYIVYLSVRQAGWSDVAAKLTAKSRRLFMDDWLPRHHANENYPPEGRTDKTQFFVGNGGRDPHYVWAGLLPMLALEELFSIEDVCEGIRFGTTEPDSFGSWSGFLYQGKRGGIRVDAEGLKLEIKETLQVQADAPLAIRQFVAEGPSLTFRCDAIRATTIRVQSPESEEKIVALPPGNDQLVKLVG
ncbi:MAG: MGH1-like glycoside hydrolase domain-containing protein [Verrucomicrobiota bacterium]